MVTAVSDCIWHSTFGRCRAEDGCKKRDLDLKQTFSTWEALLVFVHASNPGYNDVGVDDVP